MKYNELSLQAKRPTKRVGRGISAGQGKTAGRGTKGQNARTGGQRRPGFEGGQNPLYMRMPKLRGFRAVKPKAETVYTGQISTLKGVIDNFSLFDAGLTTSPYVRVKLVVKGEISGKLSVKLQGASETAIAAIQKAGGTFTVTPQVKRTPKEKPADKPVK